MQCNKQLCLCFIDNVRLSQIPKSDGMPKIDNYDVILL